LKNTGSATPYSIGIKSTTSSSDQWPQLKSLIERRISEVSDKNYAGRPSYAKLDFDYKRDIAEIREYKTIDFILPGQLGFSLLSTGVFGVAFMFFNLRNTLVLKTFFCNTYQPYLYYFRRSIKPYNLSTDNSSSNNTVGHYCFDFTLINGY
jgi:ABC-2 type transport system permease protein